MKRIFAYYFIPGLILSLFFIWVLRWQFPPLVEQRPLPLKPQLQHQPIHLQKIDFSDLEGWQTASLHESLAAFKISCSAFLKQDPEKDVGSSYIPLKAKDWQPVCRALNALESMNQETAKLFFETWFKAFEFQDDAPIQGLFTGYYLPKLKGSLVRTEEFSTPVYGMPTDLIKVSLTLFNPDWSQRPLVGRVNKQSLLPYYTRKEINHHAIDNLAPILAWLPSQFDRLILEIEGSGVIELPNGSDLYLGYAAQNGAKYTPIANVLIKKGVMTKDSASMQRIAAYFKEHPGEMEPVIENNQSFVFFSVLRQKAALGSQGVELSPGYSLAVDRKWIPLGAPIWLETQHPLPSGNKTVPFKRLMIAQDTGGAIKGVVRGDVYFGAGEEPAAIAGKMKHPGRYWVLLPHGI